MAFLHNFYYYVTTRYSPLESVNHGGRNLITSTPSQQQHDFTSHLPKAIKVVEEIKEIVDIVYRYKGLKRKLIYVMLKMIKDLKNTASQGHLIPKKTALTDKIMISVASAIAAGRHFTIYKLSYVHMMQFGTISHILHKELGLGKKLACRVSKLLALQHDKMLQGFHQAHPKSLMGHLGGHHCLG
jgi:hypothetical protein